MKREQSDLSTPPHKRQRRGLLIPGQVIPWKARSPDHIIRTGGTGALEKEYNHAVYWLERALLTINSLESKDTIKVSRCPQAVVKSQFRPRVLEFPEPRYSQLPLESILDAILCAVKR